MPGVLYYAQTRIGKFTADVVCVSRGGQGEKFPCSILYADETFLSSESYYI